MWIGHEVCWQQLDDGVVLLDVRGFFDAKPFWCAELRAVTPIFWSGNLASESPPGLSVVVRPTVEEDTARGDSFSSFASYPMPLAAIRDIVEGESEPVQLHSVWSDGECVGMHLYTGVGTYLRSGRAWHELFDASITADLDFRVASRDDLIAFDNGQRLEAQVVWPPLERRREVHQ